jgi:hypothetical protein
MNAQEVRQQMNVPPQLQQAYDKVVAAGMQLMFGKQTREQVQQILAQEGKPEKKLAESILGLMLIMFKESNQSMPPEVMIPAGLELMAHAVDFLQKSGEEVGDEVFAEAAAEFIEQMLKKFGSSIDEVLKMASQFEKSGEEVPQ